MKLGRVRKSFQNFVLKRIDKSLRSKEYLDVAFKASQEDLEGANSPIQAHRLVLGAMSPLLATCLQSVSDSEEAVIVLPDYSAATVQTFLSLAYGQVGPESVPSTQYSAILSLCNLLCMNKQEELEISLPVHSAGNAADYEHVTIADVEGFLEHNRGIILHVDVLENAEVVDIQAPSDPVIQVVQESKAMNNDCEECPLKFDSEKDLAFHRQASHKKPLTFNCAQCGKAFDKETSLRHHKIAAHHGNNKVKLTCDKCQGRFTGKSALTRHVLHCDGRKSLECNICGKVYARKDNLLNHLTRHGGVQIHCEFCGKGFRTNNDVYKHKKRLHPNESGLKSAYVVKCDLCGRRFTDKGKAYKDHLDYHEGIKNYECTYCDRRFGTAGALKEHTSHHSGLSTHACKLCGKEFRRIQNIRQHLACTHKINEDQAMRENIEKLFLSGVDKAKAIKEFGQQL